MQDLDNISPNPSSGQFCGGTLISAQWVLTAGHCTDQTSEVRVLLGAHDIRAGRGEEPSRLTLVSRDIRPHPAFSLAFLLNDIALVRNSNFSAN